MKYVNRFIRWFFSLKPIRFVLRYIVLLTDIIQYRWIFPRLYKKGARSPIDSRKVVFVEVKQERLTNSFELMYEYLRGRGDIDIYCHYISANTVGRFRRAARMYRMIKDIADARCVFVNDSSEVMGCFELRSGSRLVQMWHACGAFKKWGFSTAEKIFGVNEKALRRFPPHKNYSLATVSSPEVIWAYEQAFGMEPNSGIVRALGTSRTDIFFDKQALLGARERVYAAVPESADKKILLYAPTFRGRVKKARTPNVLDLDALKAALGDEYVLLIKHHPFVRHQPVIAEENADFAFNVTDSLSIEDLIMTADICISDYSSLIFEFSLFGRPMLFLAHDLEKYFDWRGFYYNYTDFVPGPIVTDTDGVIEYISDIKNRFDRQKVIDFRDKFMSACDGRSTQRIAAFALGLSDD